MDARKTHFILPKIQEFFNNFKEIEPDLQALSVLGPFNNFHKFCLHFIEKD